MLMFTSSIIITGCSSKKVEESINTVSENAENKKMEKKKLYVK